MDKAIAVTLVILPMQIVITQNSFGKALKTGFNLIWKKFFQYIVLITAGFVFLLIPVLLDNILKSTVAEASYLQPIGVALIDAFKLYIAVVFYLALFRFIKRSGLMRQV